MKANGDGRYNEALNTNTLSDEVPEPSSASFAQTLFAGFIHDGSSSAGACTWAYAMERGPTMSIAYKYADFNGNPLEYFTVPPIPTLMGIHCFGEFFHPRTRVCILPSKWAKGILGVKKCTEMAKYVFMETGNYDNTDTGCTTKEGMSKYSTKLFNFIKTSATELPERNIYGEMYNKDTKVTVPADGDTSVDTTAVNELRALIVSVYPDIFPAVIKVRAKINKGEIVPYAELRMDQEGYVTVDGNREDYLSDEEFLGIFKMKKDEFKKWKTWTARNQLKKDLFLTKV